MAGNTRVKKRRSVARNRVITVLRQQIAEGKLVPGSRLPIRVELQGQFQVSHVTLQRAIDNLAQDGFLQSRGRLGTFVADRPPFLNNYALVFPHHPGAGAWTKLWSAVAHEAVAFEQAQVRRIPIYYDIIDGTPNNETYQSLLRDVREHRLAGLMFASSPHLIEGTPLIQEPGIPRVAMMSTPNNPALKLWNVNIDGQSFVEMALDYLAKRGRKRLAILAAPGLLATFSDNPAFAANAEARGMMIRDYWQQYVWEGSPICARNAVDLLMRGTQDGRPDALIIADDNLVESAIAGLMKAGVRVGEDVDVVAHANFPLTAMTGQPIRRLGFDVRQVIARCIEAIDRQRAGEAEPQELMVQAQWEQDVPGATHILGSI